MKVLGSIKPGSTPFSFMNSTTQHMVTSARTPPSTARRIQSIPDWFATTVIMRHNIHSKLVMLSCYDEVSHV